MHLLRKIGQDTSVLLVISLISSGFGVIISPLLARGLGPDLFGQYIFIFTWINSQVPFIEFGLNTVLNRDLAIDRSPTSVYLINSWLGKILVGLPIIITLTCFAHTLSSHPETVKGLQWGFILLVSSLFNNSLFAVFRAHQITWPLLWLTLVEQLLLLLGLWGLLDQPLFVLIIWIGVCKTIQVMLTLYFYFRLNYTLDYRELRWQVVKQLLQKGWPFAFSGMLINLQFKMSLLLLAYLKDEPALALYGVANSFVEGFGRFYGAFYNALLPTLAHELNQASFEPEVKLALAWVYRGIFGLSLLIALGVGGVANPLLTLVYGAAYQPATLTLQLLLLGAVSLNQNKLLIIYLYAQKQEQFVNIGTMIGITITFGLSWVLVPTWGAAGTALALLIAETVVYGVYRYKTLFFTPPQA